jgi:Ca-activated chloride channel family protein
MLRRSLLAIALLFFTAPAAMAETAAASVREGNSLYIEGKYEEALEKYQAAQVESPGDRRIMFNLGDAQYRLERHDKALPEYLRAAEDEDKPMSARSHYNAGNALYRAGRLEDAIGQYLKTLELDPDDEDAKYNLEFVRREIERREKQQQQRQQQQEQQDQDSSSEIGEPQEQDKKPNEQDGSQPKDAPEQRQDESEQEKDSQPQSAPEEKQDGQPGRQEKEPSSEQSASDENIQRWLDAVEAESADNMKDFLKKQQPNQIVSYPEDW